MGPSRTCSSLVSIVLKQFPATKALQHSTLRVPGVFDPESCPKFTTRRPAGDHQESTGNDQETFRTLQTKCHLTCTSGIIDTATPMSQQDSETRPTCFPDVLQFIHLEAKMRPNALEFAADRAFRRIRCKSWDSSAN